MLKRAGGFARRNAIAIVALFVALGGTSYAAFGVPINSVGSSQIRNGAIPSSKLTLGNKNYLRLGFGAPAAAILAKPALAGSTSVSPNTSPGSTLNVTGNTWTQAANTSDIAFGVASVTVPSACTSARLNAYVGNELVASGRVTSGNSGNAQTIGLRPEGGILTGGQTAQTLTVKAVNSCATDITVASLSLSIAGFK